jgi:hypothetical protein
MTKRKRGEQLLPRRWKYTVVTTHPSWDGEHERVVTGIDAAREWEDEVTKKGGTVVRRKKHLG